MSAAQEFLAEPGVASTRAVRPTSAELLTASIEPLIGWLGFIAARAFRAAQQFSWRRTSGSRPTPSP